MKNNNLLQQFPQIYRFITAGTDFTVFFYHQTIVSFQQIKNKALSQKITLLKRLVPVLVVGIYLIFSNIYSPGDFEKAKLNVLTSPNNAQNHLALSLIFAKNNDLNQAIKEAEIAQGISPHNSTISGTLSRFQQLNQRPEKLKQKYLYWEGVSKTHEDYRDAFLYQADLAFQLKNTAHAKEFLQKALSLDPNNEFLIEFNKLILKKS